MTEDLSQPNRTMDRLLDALSKRGNIRIEIDDAKGELAGELGSCVVCQHSIPIHAQKCTHCDSFQTPWRRWINVSSGTLSLFVALGAIGTTILTNLDKLPEPSPPPRVELVQASCGGSILSLRLMYENPTAQDFLVVPRHARVLLSETRRFRFVVPADQAEITTDFGTGLAEAIVLKGHVGGKGFTAHGVDCPMTELSGELSVDLYDGSQRRRFLLGFEGDEWFAEGFEIIDVTEI